MTNVTILGTGFGALTTIRELRKRNVEANITVISPRDHLHYVPSIIWIPPRLRQGDDLKIPLTPYFARNDVTYVKASVTGLAEGGRKVLTDRGDLLNDHLVIATGGRFIRKLPGIEHALIPCEGIAVGEEIERRLAKLSGGTIAIGFGANSNEPSAVRGGPMFEFLFIIDSLLRRQKRRERFDLVFFNASNRPGARLGEKAVDGLLAEMKRRDIKTHLGHKLVRFEADKVVTEGEQFSADLILFLPGLTGPAWLEHTDLPLSPGGMIRADAKCRVEGCSNVWVVGDAGSFPGPDWLPKQAHQADLQATATAKNIKAVLSGRKPTTDFKPELICIVDMLNAGTVVYRSRWLNLVGPRTVLFHWLKRIFEGHYLHAYR